MRVRFIVSLASRMAITKGLPHDHFRHHPLRDPIRRLASFRGKFDLCLGDAERGYVMSDQRKGGIAWTDETWNPLRGCSRVSQGCVNCYAESMAVRFAGPGQPYEGTINLETKRWNGK